MINLRIECIPRPQKRHRDSRYGKYDPSHKDKQEFRALVKSALVDCDEDPVSWGAYHVEMEFAFPIPKSWPKYKKANPPICTKHVDLDNLCKIYLDSCNGLLWGDDSLIISLNCKKIYANEASVTIRMQEIPLKKN